MSRTDPGYEDFREKVLKRDKYTCQMPDCGSKHSLVVHHINQYSRGHQRVDPDNGITLCRHCHKRTFGKEKQYAPMFLSIINDYYTRH